MHLSNAAGFKNLAVSSPHNIYITPQEKMEHETRYPAKTQFCEASYHNFYYEDPMGKTDTTAGNQAYRSGCREKGAVHGR